MGGSPVSDDEPAQAVRAAVLCELEELQRTSQCWAVLGVRLCLVHEIEPPAWLRDEYIRRCDRVTDAHIASWDDAFGRFWPARTRLADVRRRSRLKSRVYAAAWALVGALPDISINRDLFERIGESREISLSGAAVERLYYEALSDGMLNIAAWRARQKAQSPAVAVLRRARKAEDEHAGR